MTCCSLVLNRFSITLKVVASPDRDFDGTTNVTFKATDIGSLNSTGANQDQGGETLSSFNVTFYHCAGGSFWNRSVSAEQSLMEGNDTCRGCSDALEGDTQVNEVDCSRWTLHIYIYICPTVFYLTETDYDI